MSAARCPVCLRLIKRSNQANRRYFALVALCVPFTYNGKRWSKKEWHEYFKDMFIEPRVIQLPSGKRAVRDPESSDLDTDEFAVFSEKVTAWCAAEGVFLPEEIE